MKIGTVAFVLRHLDTVSGSLLRAFVPAAKRVLAVVPEKIDFPWTDHDVALSFVVAEPGIELLNDTRPEPPGELNLLVLGWSHQHPWRRDERDWLQQWTSRAERTALLYFNDFGNLTDLWKQQASDRWSFHGVLRNVSAMVNYSGPSGPDIFRLPWIKHQKAFIGPNLGCLYWDDCRTEIVKAWEAQATRPVTLSFLGSEGHSARWAILRQVGDALAADSTWMLDRSVCPSPSKKRVFHLTPPRRLSQLEYLKALQRSNFSLCPLGGSHWTHRTMECLLSGSIPIVGKSSLEYYGDLAMPGSTLLVVEDEHDPVAWLNAVRSAVAMPHDEIVRMRKAIQAVKFADEEAMFRWLRTPFDA